MDTYSLEKEDRVLEEDHGEVYKRSYRTMYPPKEYYRHHRKFITGDELPNKCANCRHAITMTCYFSCENFSRFESRVDWYFKKDGR